MVLLEIKVFYQGYFLGYKVLILLFVFFYKQEYGLNIIVKKCCLKMLNISLFRVNEVLKFD